MIELAFRADPRRGEPLYRQLAGYLRELVEAGRLAPGQKLPATRELAACLGLSRTTANLAYESLVDAGLLRAHVGQGTFVAQRSPSRAPAQPALRPGFAWEGLLTAGARASRWPDAWRARSAGVPLAFDFRPGRVDATELPRRELRRAFAHALGEPLAKLANRSDPYGWPPLREAIARSLVARGIACSADDVLIVGGVQQGLDRVARALLEPGDAVVLEQPGYFGASVSFAAHGALRIGVAVDEQGLRTDQLARVLRSRRVKLVYTTPAVQAPTGVVLGDSRRAELLELAEAHQTPILEDDYDSELRGGGPAVPALKTGDDAGRVVYLGTFSKALFPALRLGYVVAARPLLARLAEIHRTAGFGNALLAQAALAELLTSGALERHVRRMRRRYAQRIELAVTAFDAAMPEGATRIAPAGGSTLWARLPNGSDPEAVRVAAAAEGIVYGRGEPWWLDGGGADHFQLGLASVPSARVEEGVRRLGEIVQHLRGAARAPRAGAARRRA